MGCQCSTEEKVSEDPKFVSDDDERGLYIAMGILNANRAASLMVRDICPEHLQYDIALEIIRRAKNDGRTVSVVNGCLYLDYKFAGFMPTGVPTSAH